MDNEKQMALDCFLENSHPGPAEIIRVLNSLILSADGRLDAAIKWGRLTYALDGDFHHWICALNISKKNVGLIFHFGGLLNDEKGLFIKGTSKFLRKIEIISPGSIDREAITDFILQAIGMLPYFIENWKSISKDGSIS